MGVITIYANIGRESSSSQSLPAFIPRYITAPWRAPWAVVNPSVFHVTRSTARVPYMGFWSAESIYLQNKITHLPTEKLNEIQSYEQCLIYYLTQHYILNFVLILIFDFSRRNKLKYATLYFLCRSSKHAYAAVT